VLHAEGHDPVNLIAVAVAAMVFSPSRLLGKADQIRTG